MQHASAAGEFKADAPFLKPEAYGAALAKYAYKNIDAAVALLYALQAYSVNFGMAKGLMPNFFMALYQNDVIMEDAFMAWREDDTNRMPGKEKTVQQTEKFFDYLEQCVVVVAPLDATHPREPVFSFFFCCPHVVSSAVNQPSTFRPAPPPPPPPPRRDEEEEEDEEEEPAMQGVVRPQNSSRL